MTFARPRRQDWTRETRLFGKLKLVWRSLKNWSTEINIKYITNYGRKVT